MTTAVQLAQSVAPGVSLGFKNRIINGAMMIDQRNAGASVTAATATVFVYTIDRWTYYGTQGSKYTVQQNAGSVTPPAGFINYLGATSSSAYSPTGGDLFMLSQVIEGLNMADLGWGTANAKAVTLSFWVRSSLTGTFGGSIVNANGSYTYPFSYSISAANTWTYCTVSIAGPTSGTWNTSNGIGAYVSFSLGIGTTYASSSPNAWTSTQYWGVSGQQQVVGTNGATFYLTGVQLEVGTAATSFEFRDYGRELIMCQRYYEKIGVVVVNNVASNYPSYFWAVTKRTTATLSMTASAGSGGAVSAYPSGYGDLTGCYQSSSHSTDTVAYVTGSAEL